MSDALLALDRMLADAVQAGASDVHITAEEPIRVRVDGSLRLLGGYEEPMSLDWLEPVLSQMIPRDRLTEILERGASDFTYVAGDVGRFRVSVFRQRGNVAAALRLIPSRAYTLDELELPDIVGALAVKPRGLVLITGPTGSGKSTTLTSMVEIINTTQLKHVVMIEDPIEFLHTSRNSLIHQREVGVDTASYADALRRALRQDPDVVLLGELHDPESIAIALTAAETGHLVLSTMHTQGAAKSINRIVDAFPAERQAQVRSQLGDTLQGVVSQVLLPRAYGAGRIVATEVLINTPGVANMIREGQVAQLHSAMQAGAATGMHTLDHSLSALISSGVVSAAAAREVAEDPAQLKAVAVDPLPGSAEPLWAQTGRTRTLRRER